MFYIKLLTIYLFSYNTLKLKIIIKVYFMNTELLLIASSLLIVINSITIVSAIEDNYKMFNSEQHEIELNKNMQELDTKINEFVDKLQFKDSNEGIQIINNISDLIIHNENIINTFDFTLIDLFLFVSKGNILKTNDQILQVNKLMEKIYQAGIGYDINWYFKWLDILSYKKLIKNLI